MASEEPARVYRVAELNRRVRQKLERWGEVWVIGELADVTRATSGHLYFTLDDGAAPAQLRGVMFRGDAQRAKTEMRAGERVRVLGRFSLYEPRGGLQLIVRVAVPAGEGDRREQLERLRKKLAAEGLFAPERKRPLPRVPRVVGLVTSLRGAAVHDVVRVASARAPVRLVVADCQVQGPDAPRSIVMALRRIARLPGLDVVVVTRGGGASEDLSAFNDEQVARAIASCPVPVVSGVGHEVDSTIADWVADVRAATPSNAAEQVVPDAAALRAALDAHRRHIEQALAMRVGAFRLSLERVERRLADPRRALTRSRPRVEAARASLARAVARRLSRDRSKLAALERRLTRQEPRAALARDRLRLDALTRRLTQAGGVSTRPSERALEGARAALRAAIGPYVGGRHERLAELHAALRRAPAPHLAARRAAIGRLAAQLDALSPLAVLARGYAIALHRDTGHALIAADEAAVGDTLDLRLAAGRLEARVVAVHPEPRTASGDPPPPLGAGSAARTGSVSDSVSGSVSDSLSDSLSDSVSDSLSDSVAVAGSVAGSVAVAGSGSVPPSGPSARP